QDNDPAQNSISSANGLAGSFNLKVIKDSQGRFLLINPGPGQIGTLDQAWIEGPARLGLDMNLIKRVAVAETKTFEIRMDATNVRHKPIWGNPNTNINSDQFGRITSATGARRFTLGARLEF